MYTDSNLAEDIDENIIDISNISSLNRSIKKIDGKMCVVKENSLAKTPLKFTLPEHRLVNIISSFISPNDTKDTEYTFPIKAYSDFFALDERGNHTELKKAIKSLMSKPVEIRLKDGRTIISPWIAKAELIPGKGLIKVKVNAEILPLLLYSPEHKINGYLKYRVAAIRSLFLPTAYNLYSYLRSAIGTSDTITLYCDWEQLKIIMAVEPQKYKEYKSFKNRILLPAISNINGDIETLKNLGVKKYNPDFLSTSDIKVEYREKLDNRKVVGVFLKIKRVEVQVNDEKTLNTIKEIELLRKSGILKESLVRFGLSPQTANKIQNVVCEKYDIERILKNAKYAYDTYIKRKDKQTPIYDLISFTIYSIKENIFADAPDIDKKENTKYNNEQIINLSDPTLNQNDEVIYNNLWEKLEHISEKDFNNLLDEYILYLNNLDLDKGTIQKNIKDFKGRKKFSFTGNLFLKDKVKANPDFFEKLEQNKLF